MAAAAHDHDGVDHYAVLGVDVTATAPEIRRAYRRLALRCHPDRAGDAGAPQFRRVAAAYQVLSDPEARFHYDAARRRAAVARVADSTGRNTIGFAPDGRPTLRHRPVPDPLPRLTGPLATLVDRGVAAVAPDGTVDLHLVAHEAAVGGTAVVDVPLSVACPSCGGVSRPGGVWCRRCDFAGVVIEPVSVYVTLPPEIEDGAVIVIPAQRAHGRGGPLRFRVRTR